MNIIGLSFDYHDSAAALVADGEVVAAAQEERFSRKKHDARFPRLAIDSCLEQAGLKRDDVDFVAHYEKPLLKLDRIVYGALRALPRGAHYLRETFVEWLREGKFDVRERIVRDFGIARDKVEFVQHHAAHSASAFYCSPFERATVVTLDGVGEHETATVWRGDRQGLRKRHAVRYPDSIGLFYSALTAFLGFEVNGGEYKVMGMSGFGRPRHLDAMRKLLRYGGGRFHMDQSYFDFFAPEKLPFTPKLVQLLGTPREPDTPFEVGDLEAPAAPGSAEERCRHYADIAASLQQITEEAIMDFVDTAVREHTGVPEVAMAGGVALNALATGRLQRELGHPLYVQPAAGDSGGALGAALLCHMRRSGVSKPRPLADVFLGPAYDDRSVDEALAEAQVDSYERFSYEAEMLEEVAKLLAEGAVVGWQQGRFEWGPRALGSRSILGNPTLPDMQARINEKIKFREPFRPFAPAVLAERATEYFDLPEPHSRLQPETFMLSVCRVRREKRLPAVTHVDGTARVQLVWKESRTVFRRLLETFEKRSGTPVLLNTSFNRNREPIVASPADAVSTFLWSGLDYLVINNTLVRKESWS